ncbi:MAG: AI-2E family transporter [Anaerolineae bacterium]|nr:AI-2E family transporter [Anaerolineae bacterium]
MTKRLVWMGTAVMSTLLALLLLWQLRTAVIYVLISVALAVAIRPLIKRPTGQGLARRLLMLSLYLVTLVGLGFLLVLMGGAMIRDVQELVRQLSEQDAWRQPVWLRGSSFQHLLDVYLPPPSELFAAITGDEGQLVLPAALSFTQGVFSVLSSGLVVLFLSLYWSIDQVRFERLWLSLLPPGQRARARDIWQTIESDLGDYIRSEVAQSVLAGLMLGLGYWALGSPYPALLALTGAILLLIPVIGAVLATIMPLLSGLLTGVPLSLLTAVYTLAVVATLNWWVEPRLTPHRRASPMLTVVFLIVLADAYGLFGIILAPPLSAACQILWNRMISHRTVSGAAAQVSDLKERQVQLEATIKALDEPLPLVINYMARLTHLIEQAEPTLQTAVEQSGLLPLSEHA